MIPMDSPRESIAVRTVTPVRAVDMEGVVGASKQVPIGKQDGAPNFSVRVFTIEPDGHTPHHSHESEHINYILQGEGELLEGDQPRPISQGNFVLIEPHEKHQFRNTGNEPCELITACTPPTF